MFQFTKQELLDLLSKTFDEGHNGYQDLKDCFISKIIEDLEVRKEKAETTRDDGFRVDPYVRSDVYQRTSRPWIVEEPIQTLPGWPEMSQRDFEELLQRSIEQLSENFITNSSNSATIAPQYVVSSNSVNYYRNDN